MDGIGCGEALIMVLFSAIIEPQMTPKISWLGRGKGPEKKIAMKKYVNTLRFMAQLCKLADNQYTASDCQKHLTYNIFKRSGTNNGDDDDCVLSYVFI